MTAPGPTFTDLMQALSGLSTQLAAIPGKDGRAIRGHVERLAAVLGQPGPAPGSSDADDAGQRSRAADELDQLVTALGRLGRGKPPPGSVDLGQLAGGLRQFAGYLRAPTAANQAEVAELFRQLPGAVPGPPVPLDELRIDATIEALAVESARRHGLEGKELRAAVQQMQREMTKLVGELERRAQQEASRTRTADKFDQLLGQVVAAGGGLGAAIDGERPAIRAAFRAVDLAHMAEGLRVFAEWLSTPADDPTAHVAALHVQLAAVLGPPTTGDPGRSEAERRADFERDIRVAVDQIFQATRPAP